MEMYEESENQEAKPIGEKVAYRQSIYRSFMEVLIAKKEGGEPDTFTYPTVSDGVDGVRFIDACVKSNAEGNVWVDV